MRMPFFPCAPLLTHFEESIGLARLMFYQNSGHNRFDIQTLPTADEYPAMNISRWERRWRRAPVNPYPTWINDAKNTDGMSLSSVISETARILLQAYTCRGKSLTMRQLGLAQFCMRYEVIDRPCNLIPGPFFELDPVSENKVLQYRQNHLDFQSTQTILESIFGICPALPLPPKQMCNDPLKMESDHDPAKPAPMLDAGQQSPALDDDWVEKANHVARYYLAAFRPCDNPISTTASHDPWGQFVIFLRFLSRSRSPPPSVMQNIFKELKVPCYQLHC
jgi:hypothetical protein